MAGRTLALPVGAAFDLVTDFSRHGEWIPFTRMAVPTSTASAGTGARAGDTIVATTALVLVDRMTIDRLEPPTAQADGVAVLRKTGPLLLGTARITVRAVGGGRSHVRWDEDVWLRGPVPRSITRVALAPFLDAMAAFALWRIGRSTHT